MTTIEEQFADIEKEPDPVKKLERLEDFAMGLMKANKILQSERRMMLDTFNIEEIELEPASPLVRA